MHLVERVTGCSSFHQFEITGLLTCADLLHYIRPHRDPATINRFLDWGCGCGRLTYPLMEQLPRAEAYGVDSDVEMVDWMTEALPRGRFARSPDALPLDFADGCFDVVFAISVMEHMSREDQDIWLRELRRILAPGGLLVATTHGPHAAALQFQPRILQDMAENGIHDGLADAVLAAVLPRPYHCAAFQTTEYTRRSWGDVFEVVEHVEAGMDSFKDVWILVKQ